MSFDRTLRHLTEQASLIKNQHAGKFAEQAHAFLRLGGGFPVSRDLVSRVRSRLGRQSVTASSLSRYLSAFPVLSARLIALCNQTYYMRGQEVTTLDAGMNQLGLLRMADILEELGVPGPFSNALHGRAIAGAQYQEMIMSNLLALRFYKILSPLQQAEHLSALLCGMSSLSLFSLSYLRPEIYSALLLDNFTKEQGRFDRTFKRVFRSSSARFSASILDEMNIPRVLSDRVSLLEIAPWNRRTWVGAAEVDVRCAAIAAYLAQRTVREFYRFRDSHYLTKLLKDFETRMRTPLKKFQECLSGLSDDFLDVIEDLGLVPLRIPEYLRSYDDLILDEDKKREPESRRSYTLAQRLQSSLVELKACVN
ncbi:MAG: HDOD domain-containing protein, partial [Bdellovibrionales bacterium]|nr:HDOD domain-containing protein [Bdellovibrionales bacterium]